MDYTANLNLIKPAKAEQFNIDYHNTNSDIIDAAFKSEVETRFSVDAALQEQIDLNRNEERRIGIVPIEKGGTGKTTAQSALNALHGSVATESSINADDEITFIRRTAADASTETPETIDLKDVTLQTLADKVYDLIRGDSAIFSSTKNGFVPKSGAAGNALYLNAAGGWTEPGFSESTMDIASSKEITVVSNTILTFTASQSVTVVLKDCDKRGVTATFFNPTSYRHTLSLKFFGGSDTAYIKAGETVRLWWTGSAWLNLALSAHGINSLYWSSDNTDPKYIYGGTWKRIKDRFVLAAGDTYANGATGGSVTVALNVTNMPSHSHDFTPSGTVSVKNNPTFSGTPHSHTRGTMNIKGFVGDLDRWRNTLDNSTALSALGISQNAFYKPPATVRLAADGKSGDSGVIEATYFDASRSWTGSTESVTAGGSISGGSYEFTGSTGTTETNGSGKSFSIMPPYIVKFCWERVS